MLASLLRLKDALVDGCLVLDGPAHSTDKVSKQKAGSLSRLLQRVPEERALLMTKSRQGQSYFRS